MNIQKLLENKSNIAFLGDAGCGKGVAMKKILQELLSNNKKVLVLEPCGEKEYKQITELFGGSYWDYSSLDNISYTNNLTTISLINPLDDNPNVADIELVLKIIKEGQSNGIEVVLIDEALNYLMDCKRLRDNIHAQLIVGSQLDFEILNKKNQKDFKELFDTIFLMSPTHNLQLYLGLLDLYNIGNIFIKDLKAHQRYESVVIQDKQLIETHYKFRILEELK